MNNIKIIFFVFFSCCFYFTIDAQDPYKEMIDKKWTLYEMTLYNMEPQDLSHRQYFLIFHYNKEMTYKLDTNPGKIKIKSINGNRIEYAYLKSDELSYNGKVAEKIYFCLTKATYFATGDDSLVFYSDIGKIKFYAEPYKDSGFTGEWVLTSYTNTEKEESLPLSEKMKRPITIHFNDDGTEGVFSGFTEENEKKGKYEFIDSLEIKINKINTPQKTEKNEWNEKFWEVIRFVTFYRATGDSLLLFYNEDKEYMEFQPVEEEDTN